MRNLLVITMLLATSGASSAPIQSRILAYGLCEHRTPTRRYELPQSAAGYATLGKNVITQRTDDVPLRKGIGFGFTWQAEGLPEIANIVFHIEHPLITKPDGTKLRSFDEPMQLRSRAGIIKTTDCYILSEDHELVAGAWSIAVTHNGVPLVKRSFRVILEPEN